MTDTTNTEPAHNIDAGAPTDNEARLTAQLATIGENPLVDPDAAPAAPDAAAAAAAAAADAPPAAGAVPAVEGAPAPEAGGAATDDAAATAAAAAAAAAAASVPAPVVPAAAPPAPPQAAMPTPPKDFDAEFLAVQKRYDEGEIDSGEFQAQSRALSKEESVFNTRLTLWQEEQTRAANAATVDFNAASAAWMEANKDFMSNPVRRDAMQRAIEVIDRDTGGKLPSQELLTRAAEAAFEAFGYKPVAAPAAGGPTAAEVALAAATAGRTPPAVPQTLASAPAAASMERPAGNTAYGTLDGSDINSLELALAKMTPDAVEAYLRDAPGATTSGKPSGTPE